MFRYIYNNFPFDKKLGNVTSTTLYNYLCLNESNLPNKGISIFIMSKVKIKKKINSKSLVRMETKYSMQDFVTRLKS